MKGFNGFDNITRRGEPLSAHTTFRIGGPAEVFVEPRDLAEFREVVAFCHRAGLRMLVLGAGSNLLVSDEGVSGVVVVTHRLDHVFRKGTTVVAEAGVPLPRFVHLCARWGLGGLEPLIGIPGTVGGSVAMNAGGKYGTIGRLVASATVIQPDGTLQVIPKGELAFGNRTSSLRTAVIAEVAFELAVAPSEALVERCRAILAEKRRSQPLKARSAGCIFRNPPGHHAGALIDGAGLKAESVGDATVSPKHANFIVNTGKASARDVARLIDMVRQRVAEQFKVDLQTEVELWGFRRGGHRG